MCDRRPLISVVLAAALLLGLWLCATHDSEHGLKPGAAQACAVCVYAHGAGAGMLPAIATLKLNGAHEAPVSPEVDRQLAANLRHHPIRGPPALLV